MLGTATTWKLVALVPEPAVVLTVIGPVVAPAGTVAVIWVFESTVKLLAATPPKLTAVAPVKLLPVIVNGYPNAATEWREIGDVGRNRNHAAS